MKNGLVIGVDGLALPRSIVTSVTAICGTRETGKSYATHKVAEQVVKADIAQVIIFDPKGDYHGLRHSATGKSAGLPFVMLGGERGDLPLEPGSGEIVAEAAIAHGNHMILDLSDFPTDADEHRFAYDFATRLWRLKARDRRIIWIVYEEASTFLPQNFVGGGLEPVMVGAIKKFARLGRQRGIGLWLADQRIASVNKNALSQASAILCGRLTSPNDRKAFDDYLKGNGTDEERRAAAQALPTLQTGNLLLWAPSWGHTTTSLRVAPIETYDSHRTPEPGDDYAEPRGRPSLDISALAAAMADVVQRAEETDPSRLRARIGQLEKELTVARAARPEPERVAVHVPDPVSAEHVRRAAEAVRESTQTLLDAARVVDAAVQVLDGAPKPAALAAVPDTAPSHPKPRAAPPGRAAPPARARGGDGDLTEYQADLLRGLAVRSPATAAQLSVITGRSHKSSAFEANVKVLRDRGYVEPGKPYRITPEGRARLGDTDPIPTGAELLAYWRARITQPAPLAFLDAIAAAGPSGVGRDELCEATGYSPTSSGTDAALKYLRDLGLVAGGGGAPYRVADDLVAAS